MNATVPASADLLETIVAATRRIVQVREEREPLTALAARAERRSALQPGAFRSAIAAPGRINIIAECKRRSPSRGVLRADYDPVAIATRYAANGAAAISVLTEPTFFDGSLEHLSAIRQAVNLPLLRKDFIVSEYQLHEAKAAGADAVLLIVAALAPAAIRVLRERAWQLGLDALVEVHTLDELDTAVDAGAEVIGINNRNLRTLEIDVRASEAIIARMPKAVVAVSESGLKSREDLQRLRGLGYHAFLIGERFMTEADPGAGLTQLMGA
jgi:indole-3-glycerol phosphate synthase